MKRKVEILLDENVMRQAKRRAAERGVTLSNVIQEALEAYLSEAGNDTKQRLEAYNRICGNPMKLTPAQLKAVLEADPWIYPRLSASSGLLAASNPVMVFEQYNE